MRRGLKLAPAPCIAAGRNAARAAPYEKGTETTALNQRANLTSEAPRARPPMRRGLKREYTRVRKSRVSSRARGPL